MLEESKAATHKATSTKTSHRNRSGGARTRTELRNDGPSIDADVVIVSNRGPKDFVWKDDRWVVQEASGGLVSMLSPLAREPRVVWFCCVSEPPDAALASSGLFTTAADQQDMGLHVVPVPLPAAMYQAYY